MTVTNEISTFESIFMFTFIFTLIYFMFFRKDNTKEQTIKYLDEFDTILKNKNFIEIDIIPDEINNKLEKDDVYFPAYHIKEKLINIYEKETENGKIILINQERRCRGGSELFETQIITNSPIFVNKGYIYFGKLMFSTNKDLFNNKYKNLKLDSYYKNDIEILKDKNFNKFDYDKKFNIESYFKGDLLYLTFNYNFCFNRKFSKSILGKILKVEKEDLNENLDKALELIKIIKS